jgi:hypothetical protein
METVSGYEAKAGEASGGGLGVADEAQELSSFSTSAPTVEGKTE